MAFLNGFDISGYGLSAQRFRINLISSNIANANTTRTDEGGAYRRREAVFKEINFDQILSQELFGKSYENPIDEIGVKSLPTPALSGVVVDKVVRDDSPFKLKYEPSHPDANENGYVAYPNVNPVIEMADLVEATRAYQANVAAFQSSKSIAQSAIEMLKG